MIPVLKAWQKGRGEMLNVYRIDLKEDAHDILVYDLEDADKWEYVEHCKILHWSGVEDEAKNKIFDGDFIKVERLIFPEQEKEEIVDTFIAEVVHKPMFGSFWYYRVGKEYLSEDGDGFGCCSRCYVIGNKYENPELSKKWDE